VTFKGFVATGGLDFPGAFSAEGFRQEVVALALRRARSEGRFEWGRGVRRGWEGLGGGGCEKAFEQAWARVLRF